MMPGPRDSAEAQAAERVERILLRLAEEGVPLWGGSPMRAGRDLRPIRGLAERRAIEAGRDELLGEARERVGRAYVARLANMGAWTGIAGFSLPFSARERAESEMVLRDLVTAAVVEDLVPQSAVAALRADGERLLALRR
ncbi:hypothetical protein BH23CHL8_BH23CHL8_15980 [soil metagenome]